MMCVSKTPKSALLDMHSLISSSLLHSYWSGDSLCSLEAITSWSELAMHEFPNTTQFNVVSFITRKG